MDRRVTETRLKAHTDSGAIQVLALTKYGRLGASSRCRFLNYIPFLDARNISVKVAPLLNEDYVERRLTGAKIDYLGVARAYASRLTTIASAFRFDVLWMEGELFPRCPATIERLLPLLGQRFVVDLDDAIFHSYDHHPNPVIRTILGRKIDVVFDCATTVIVGNQYLAERARQTAARRIVLVPTTVDHRVYADRRPSAHDKLTVGWIGSSATAQYLQTIAPQLENLCANRPGCI